MEEKKFLYLDPSKPIPQRVRDLISRMTLEEKISQMCHPAHAIERLGIPAYNYWSEALHGVARNGRATVFPQAIGMGAMWDPALLQRVASAIGDEARAKYNAALHRSGKTAIYQGLTFWSPNINIFRDPRWGRGQETYGEDPFLTGEMGAAFVRGLQGDHPRYMKAAACAKHYAVHSGPEGLRHTFNAVVSRRDLYDTYLPAFKKLVMEAKVEAVMGAYNRTNGEPCCASQLLLVNILRGEWQFDGHVVSDCWALQDIHANHKVTIDEAESAALAIKRGCDINCGVTYEHLGEALERGLITEADIDRALEHGYTTRFRLGMFDPPDQVPYSSIPTSVIDCAEHRQLAYQAALESVVLLKNRGNVLPIKDNVRSVFITGPGATSVDILLGNYYGLNPRMVTLMEGIIANLPEGMGVEYRLGTLWTQGSISPVDWAPYEAANHDVVIACMGTAPMMEGEEGESLATREHGDRADICLPPNQEDYLKKICSTGVKVVLVLSGGSPIALGELAEMVDAIVFVWYPGEEGGKAVADLLFGKASPSGKLPLTFPQSLDQLPHFEDYAMAQRTYRYSTQEPLFPFGFGLSYTHFAYRDLHLEKTSVKAGEKISVSVTVSNQGQMKADEVVQFYLSDLEASAPVPRYRLEGFQRVSLEAGESGLVSFTLLPESMSFVDEQGKLKLEAGKFRLEVGSCSPGKRGVELGAPQGATVEFTVV